MIGIIFFASGVGYAIGFLSFRKKSRKVKFFAGLLCGVLLAIAATVAVSGIKDTPQGESRTIRQ